MRARDYIVFGMQVERAITEPERKLAGTLTLPDMEVVNMIWRMSPFSSLTPPVGCLSASKVMGGSKTLVFKSGRERNH